LYEVAPVEAVQLSDVEALPAVTVRATGAAGTEPAPEELELLLDELDDDELDDDELEEELDDEEELLELEEEDEPVPLELPPPDELEDDELEDELELLFGVAEASFDRALVPTLFTAATL